MGQVVAAAPGGPWRIVHLANSSKLMGAGFPEVRCGGGEGEGF